MQERPSSPCFNGMMVLVVEDDPASIAFLRAVLPLLGCRVEVAFDGREAILRFEPGKFGAALMDMCMPGMGGLAAMKATRGMESRQHTPIIAVTPCVMPGDLMPLPEGGLPCTNRIALRRKNGIHPSQ